MLKPTLDDFRNRDLVGPAVMVGAVFLLPIYLNLSDLLPRWRSFTDLVALLIVVGIGLAGVWMLPTSRFARAVVTPIYAILLTVVAAMWAISFRGGL